jgi:serine/threonine protein kinase
MVGTFDYMAPEQMAGNCLPQSDVFTLGIVIYEMIAGERPFGTAPGPAAMLAALLGKTPERLVQVPPLLADIVARCLAREPEDRYANASELADALAGLGERIEHEAPTVPARASSSFIGGADSMLDGATVVDRRKPDGKPEIPRVTLPGVIPHPPRPSIPRLAAGTVDPFPSPFDYAPPQAPAIPPTLPPHQVQQLRAPSPMFDIDLRPKPVWPLVLFIAIAIAVGIAIGIGFAT